MQAVHIIVQVKGGCGKSLAAAQLAQFLMAESAAMAMPIPVHCYDTDPGNHTFAGYKAFNTQIVPILPEGSITIDALVFDSMIEQIIDKEGIAVIDNGAGSFIPLIQYLSECSVLDLLKSMNIEVFFHVPVIGGQSMEDTCMGLGKILGMFDASVVVWANEHFGKLELDGKHLTELKMLKKYDDKILGMVPMKNHVDDLFGKDIAEMLKHNLTYKEVMESPSFSRMQRHRLLAIKKEYFANLANLPLFNIDQIVDKN
ncbi:conjugal transfer protein TraL [Neisseriaceae bacterium ESL0693]|nr:conjugal transfer protein TraL [Neisseriaceae bacterium ESL0693]